ncbi:MAG TPA: MarR family transcriptional regulator, partial [Amycolatopsis sp.]|nr:MarR family transcriptional regulator [Amycolatopsis sp.]
TTPEEAIAVRERASAAALRQRIGQLADSPGLVRVADLAARAAVSAPTEGRALYAGLRALDVPEEPVARLWHAATLLREHRGDSHNAALVAHGIGGTEAHVLLALSLGMKAEKFGRVHHLPKAQLAAVVDGLRGRGLVDADGGFTDTGRKTSERIEAVTDKLAAPAYDVLSADELDELIAGLEPIAAAARAADD